MSLTPTPAFAQTPFLASAALLNTTGAFTFAANSNATTNLVQIAAGTTNGTKIEMLTASSTDTSAQVLQLILNDGTKNVILGTYTIPITAGAIATTPPVDLLNSAQAPRLSFDSAGNKYFYLPSGFTLYAGTAAAITSAKQISITAGGASF